MGMVAKMNTNINQLENEMHQYGRKIRNKSQSEGGWGIRNSNNNTNNNRGVGGQKEAETLKILLV